MYFIKKQRRYSELVLGFLAFGIGQRLLGVGVWKPWAEDKGISLILGVIGAILFIGGTILLIRLLSWLLKNYNQENRVLKVLGLSLVLSVAVGFIIGLLGQFLYDHTSISYTLAKNLIWVLSSLLQVTIKMTALYSLICFYQGREVVFRKKEFQRLLWLSLLLVGMILLFSLLLPQLADILLFMADSLLILGTVYIFVIREKENI